MGAINGKNMNMDGTMLFFCCQGNIGGGFLSQGITDMPVICTSLVYARVLKELCGLHAMCKQRIPTKEFAI